MKFCPDCGHELEPFEFEGKVRGRCPTCRRVHFANPKLAVGVIISYDGRIALGKRGVPPGIGLWSFPAGYVDQGETVEEAARREVREEIGRDVRLTGLVGLYSEPGSPVVLAVYAGALASAALTGGSDMQEVAWFSLNRLPPLAFPRDLRILEEWRRLQEGLPAPQVMPEQRQPRP